jgi:dipeptidyl aminopeptidase/acylaminoacyl peptidase
MPGAVPDAYAAQSNLPLAHRLQGKLMLVYGDTDDDVNPANTIQLIDALIRANKDFDLLVLPNRNHSEVAHDPYFYRRRWDYFIEHLLHARPPHEYLLAAPSASTSP